MRYSYYKLSDELEANKSKKEPLFNTTMATVTPVLAIYTILSLVFPSIPQDTLNIIAATVAFILPYVISFLVRKKVWSPATVANYVEDVRERTKLAVDREWTQAADKPISNLNLPKKMD